MLRLHIPDRDFWDPIEEKFIHCLGADLELEHSLESVSKWETKWHIPFHDDRHKKTYEQNVDYVRCMTLTEGVDPKVYNYMTEQNVQDIVDYIGDSATATWFRNTSTRHGKKEIVTAEVIYFWMTTYNIPESYQRWHLNKLMTLLRVAAEKSNPDNKKNRTNFAAERRALNAARRKKFNTKG